MSLKIGVELQINNKSLPAVPRWPEIRQVARRAEEVGFDSIWVEDHLIFSGPDGEEVGVWEGWTTLTALAVATERVELGTLVACTGFRNPALLAKMAATLDEISGGRLILGLGAGWNEREYEAFGYPYDHRYSRFEEALRIISGLLRDGEIDFQGTYYGARRARLLPPGPRPSGPPLLLGTVGAKMLRLTARYADAWNAYFSMIDNSPARFADLQRQVDAACAEIGRDPATLTRTVGVLVDVGGDRGRRAGPWSVPPLAGSPRQIADGLRAFEQAGADEIQVWIEPTTLAGIEGFAPVIEELRRGADR